MQPGTVGEHDMCQMTSMAVAAPATEVKPGRSPAGVDDPFQSAFGKACQRPFRHMVAAKRQFRGLNADKTNVRSALQFHRVAIDDTVDHNLWTLFKARQVGRGQTIGQGNGGHGRQSIGKR